MQRHRTGRRRGAILAILVAVLAGTFTVQAQKNDTPIVILDGSLIMRSEVPWSKFTGNGDQRGHPESDRAVTQVVVKVKDVDTAIDFAKEQCTVDVTYDKKHIKVTTGKDGTGLKVAGLNSFVRGESDNHLAHKNQSAHITHLTVTKGGSKAFDSDIATLHTQITISYR